MASHVQYLQWAGCAGLGLAALRQLVLITIRLIAIFSGSEQVSLRSFEIIRLCRRDAARIPSYLSEPSKVSEGSEILPLSVLPVKDVANATLATQHAIIDSSGSRSRLGEPLLVRLAQSKAILAILLPPPTGRQGAADLQKPR